MSDHFNICMDQIQIGKTNKSRARIYYNGRERPLGNDQHHWDYFNCCCCYHMVNCFNKQTSKSIWINSLEKQLKMVVHFLLCDNCALGSKRRDLCSRAAAIHVLMCKNDDVAFAMHSPCIFG